MPVTDVGGGGSAGLRSLPDDGNGKEVTGEACGAAHVLMLGKKRKIAGKV
jgi:hypothetical protein